MVRSLSDANKKLAAFERNIAKAEKALFALTPEPKQGRRQIQSKAKLIQKAEAVLTEYDVENYLRYTFVKQQSVVTQYIGPGRGSANRKKRQVRTSFFISESYHLPARVFPKQIIGKEPPVMVNTEINHPVFVRYFLKFPHVKAEIAVCLIVMVVSVKCSYLTLETFFIVCSLEPFYHFSVMPSLL